MGAPNPTVPNVPMPQPGQGGQGPGGFPVAQPGFLAPAPPQPSGVVNPELAPPDPDALTLDPLVLSRPIKITINASERMRTRGNLQQSIGFIAQFAMNGPFLQELAQSNLTVDFVDFARMIMDATGLQQDYRLFRDMTPQEQQQRQQPSPDTVAKGQQAQQELQTRMQLMQMKVQGEQAVAQIEAMVKDKAISEESARHLLTIFQKEKSDQMNAPDPREALMNLQLKAGEHAQNMQQMQQKHQQDMQMQAQRHVLDLTKAAQSHNLDLQQQRQQVQHDAHAAQTKMVFDHLANRQKLQQSEEAHKKKLSLMKATPKPATKK